MNIRAIHSGKIITKDKASRIEILHPQDLGRNDFDHIFFFSDIASFFHQVNCECENILFEYFLSLLKKFEGNILANLELFLAQFNKKIKGMLSKSVIANIADFNISVVVFSKSDISLATAGSMQSYIEKEHTFYPINTANDECFIPIFSNIYQGKLSHDESILVGNKKFFSHFSFPYLSDLFSTQSETIIKKTLKNPTINNKEQNSDDEKNAPTFLYVQKTQVPTTNIQKDQKSSIFDEEPFEEESFLPIKEQVYTYKPYQPKRNENSTNQKDEGFSRYRAMTKFERRLYHFKKETFRIFQYLFSKNIFGKLKMFFGNFSAAIKKLFSFSMMKKQIDLMKSNHIDEIKISNFANRAKKVLTTQKEKIHVQYSQLSRRRRFAFLGSLLFAVFFSSLVYYQLYSREQKKKDQFYSEILKEAKEKFEKGKNADIFDDDEYAKNLLYEAKELNGQVLGSSFYKKEAKKLDSEINQELEGRNMVIRVGDEQQEIFNFNTIEKKGSILHLAKLGGKFIFSEEKNIIFLDDHFANLERRTGAIEGDTKIKLFSNVYENKFYTVCENDDLYKTDADLNVSKLTLDKVPGENINTIQTFRHFLYVLDTTHKKVFKHQAQGNRFLVPQTYINSTSGKIFGMGIDGAIYLAGENTIEKYFGSIKREFTTPKIEPPILFDERVIIETHADIEFVFIADPSQKRILKLSKGGKLSAQFVHDEYANITDLLASSDEKEFLYILSNEKVLKLRIL